MVLSKVGQQVTTCMTRILLKLVLGIHVFLGFMCGGKIVYIKARISAPHKIGVRAATRFAA